MSSKMELNSLPVQIWWGRCSIILTCYSRTYKYPQCGAKKASPSQVHGQHHICKTMITFWVFFGLQHLKLLSNQLFCDGRPWVFGLRLNHLWGHARTICKCAKNCRLRIDHPMGTYISSQDLKLSPNLFLLKNFRDLSLRVYLFCCLRPFPPKNFNLGPNTGACGTKNGGISNPY